jgi:hypothetical protein
MGVRLLAPTITPVERIPGFSRQETAKAWTGHSCEVPPKNRIPVVYVRFEIFTAVRMMMKFFWVLAPCRLNGTCQRFGETYCLHLQGWIWWQYVSPKRWNQPTSQHGVTNQNKIVCCCWTTSCRLFPFQQYQYITVKAVPLHAMEALGGRRYSSYSFLTSALDGGEWSASRPGRVLPPGKRTPGTHWIGGWVGPRAGLDAGARRKICLCRGSNLDRPIVQPVVRHYTAWATATPVHYSIMHIFCPR